jgi:hypothetical protein
MWGQPPSAVRQAKPGSVLLMPEELQTDERPAESHPEAVDAASRGLSEDLALAQLKDGELTADVIEEISQNAALMKSRKVHAAVAGHSKTPRRIALRLIRELYTFELMKFAMTPTVAADLKRIADELLLARLAGITRGERISLARRSSERVAGALLLDKETPVWQAALENGRLTEAVLVRALQRTGGSPAFVEAVSRHGKWSVRLEVQIALLRNMHTPMVAAIKFAQRLAPHQLRDVLHTSRLPESVKSYLRK